MAGIPRQSSGSQRVNFTFCPKMAISAEEMKEMKRKVSSQKSWFTRMSTETERAADRFGPKPNQEAAVSLQTFSAKLDKMYLSLL